MKTTTQTITVGTTSVIVEVADTPPKQTKGLSRRDMLAQGHGMLFVYSEKAERYFWMKDMRFPLDVLWIADDVVIGMQQNILYEPVQGQIVRFQSLKPADRVLEVNAGWIAENGVKIGDIVDFGA